MSFDDKGGELAMMGQGIQGSLGEVVKLPRPQSSSWPQAIPYSSCWCKFTDYLGSGNRHVSSSDKVLWGPYNIGMGRNLQLFIYRTRILVGKNNRGMCYHNPQSGPANMGTHSHIFSLTTRIWRKG